jgi:enoyl-CoA hydratase/3-hydroxyacyl-CoA dehydrogenase
MGIILAATKQYQTIEVKKENRVAWITLNRPHRLNTITQEMLQELSSAFDGIDGDSEIRAVVITGAGDRAFCAGADVTAFASITPATAVEAAMRGQEVFAKIERLGKPVIAALNGYALGGGLELALACDFRLAAENAEVGQTEVKLGLIPGWGGTQRLTRTVGLAKAKELILLGDRIRANRALEIGLVSKVVPKEKLGEEATALAKSLADGPPVALKLAKYALNFGTQAPLDVGLKLEAEGFGIVLSSKDVFEGISAFMEKRKPEFEGK